MNLRSYQKQAVLAVKKNIDSGINKMLLHLPTGSGKTVIAAFFIQSILKKSRKSRVLILAHRKEILDQTREKIIHVIPNASVEIEQGQRTANLKSEIIIASIQSLSRRKYQYPRDHFTAIVCDECHHSLASSWIDTLQYFMNKDIILIGLTATARRTDGRSALNLFQDVAFEIEQSELQDLGFLAPIEYHTTKTDLFLDRVKLSQGDFQTKALASVMNSPEIRAITIGAWELKASGRKTIVFCASVNHAFQLAADFQNSGYTALPVDGRTKDREEILQKFRSGEVQILTNYGVFVEGFDEPSIECVLLARPTKSPLIYNQCLGRGLRTFPGKKNCLVIDIVDRSTHQLQYSAQQLNGLPDNWKSTSDPFKERKSLSKVKVTDPSAFLKISKAENLKEVQEILMELPPESVLAGLDGKPVLYYQMTESKMSKREAIRTVSDMLAERFINFKKISFSCDEIIIYFENIDQANIEYSYLKWHLRQATGYNALYHQYTRSMSPKNYRSILRKSLQKGQRIKTFYFDEENNIVNAYVSGLTKNEFETAVQNFEMKTNSKLALQSDMSLF